MSDYVRAYEGKEPYLFVSYAHKDSGMVLPVIRELYDRKYRVWYDEGIAPGSEWPHNIATHLEGASEVMVFLSRNSVASPNCENEVIVAASQEKCILPICLDDAIKHPLLCEIETFRLDSNTIEHLIRSGRLGDELIGDGIAGYRYAIGKKKSFNLSNLMLGLAALLLVAVAVSLYGLDRGWFDRYLPAKQQLVPVYAAPTAKQEQTINISSNIIGSVLPVHFSSEEEKQAVYQMLGWTQTYEMTYNDLLGMKGLTRLDISDKPILDISFAAYLPDLELLSFQGLQISDLTPLMNCPKLQTVLVSVDMLPLKIPEERNFMIEVRQ